MIVGHTSVFPTLVERYRTNMNPLSTGYLSPIKPPCIQTVRMGQSKTLEVCYFSTFNKSRPRNDWLLRSICNNKRGLCTGTHLISANNSVTVVMILTVHIELEFRACHVPDWITSYALVVSSVISIQQVEYECSVFHVQKSLLVFMHKLAVFHPVYLFCSPSHIAHEVVQMSFNGRFFWCHDLHKSDLICEQRQASK